MLLVSRSLYGECFDQAKGYSMVLSYVVYGLVAFVGVMLGSVAARLLFVGRK
jgi:hypothetical protein